MFDVIIVMAGKGTRTNLNYNKVYYPINNIPLYRYSLSTFLEISECNRIILVVHSNEVNNVIEHKSNRVFITEGGATRQDSVNNGMKLVVSDYVLIHDGARPNIKVKDILRVYEEVKVYKASVLATPVTNTIKVSNNGFCMNTLDRRYLWSMQTPQGVRSEEFRKALIMAKNDNYIGTDDVELMEKYLSIPAKIVKGSESNLKVTTDIDFNIIELLMKEGL